MRLRQIGSGQPTEQAIIYAEEFAVPVYPDKVRIFPVIWLNTDGLLCFSLDPTRLFLLLFGSPIPLTSCFATVILLDLEIGLSLPFLELKELRLNQEPVFAYVCGLSLSFRLVVS
jgi:hypothetical protein